MGGAWYNFCVCECFSQHAKLILAAADECEVLVVFSAADAFLHSGFAEAPPEQPRQCMAAVNLCWFEGVPAVESCSAVITACRAAAG